MIVVGDAFVIIALEETLLGWCLSQVIEKSKARRFRAVRETSV